VSSPLPDAGWHLPHPPLFLDAGDAWADETAWEMARETVVGADVRTLASPIQMTKYEFEQYIF
jgi:hypothetical protein